MNSITQCCTVYLNFINTGTPTDLSRHEAKNYNVPRLHCIFFFFFWRLFLFSNHVKFDQNFVTKKPKQNVETWLVPIYGNKCLQNFSCQMKQQGQGSPKCFKTKDSRHSKTKYTYIIYIITSFINSETTALLHLTSFTEDVTNISFHMPIWEIFSEFLILQLISRAFRRVK